MALHQAITVFGAYGHTGRFVVSELRRRSWVPVLAGRDAAKLSAASETQPGVETRVALIDDPVTLDRALSGAAAVINCAGPFIDTAAPLVEAALRAGIPYLDVAAEQSSVLALFDRYAGAARDAGVAVIPAMAFYGGLGDLLATAAMGDWTSADEITVAVALDSWKPTRGTRLTGERNHGPRFNFSNHRLEKGDPPPPRNWSFPVPFGPQEVVGLQLAETITISRHLETAAVRAYINLAPLTELRNPDTPAPMASDESGRSSQVFLMDAIVRRGSEERRLTARGRDIYAITAPIVVEAVQRIINGISTATGVISAGQAFDARDFLAALSPAGLHLE